MAWHAFAAALLTGIATALLAGPLLRWCPEPEDASDKPVTYRALATPPFRVGCGLIATAAALLTWTLAPLPQQPLWTVLSTLGVLIATVDGALTWIPARLTHLAWAAGLTAVALSGLASRHWSATLAPVLGAGLLGAVFLLVWLISHPNLGFGDVRFAPLVGAGAVVAAGWPGLTLAILATTAVAAVQLVLRRIRGSQGLHPYAPAMLAGPYLALTIASWT